MAGFLEYRTVGVTESKEGCPSFARLKVLGDTACAKIVSKIHVKLVARGYSTVINLNFVGILLFKFFFLNFLEQI